MRSSEAGVINRRVQETESRRTATTTMTAKTAPVSPPPHPPKKKTIIIQLAEKESGVQGSVEDRLNKLDRERSRDVRSKEKRIESVRKK